MRTMRKSFIVALAIAFVMSATAFGFSYRPQTARAEGGEKTVYVSETGDLYSESAEGLTEATLKLTNLYGASIRLSDETAGLRFVCGVEKTGYDALKTAKDKVTFGTLIGPKDLVGNSLTLETNEDYYENAVADKTVSWYEKEVDGVTYMCYNAAISEIRRNNFEREFVAQSYMTITYANGTQETVYGAIADKNPGDTKESNVRSVSEVATAAEASAEVADYTDEELVIIRSFIASNVNYVKAFGALKGNDKDGYTLGGTSAMTTFEKTVYTDAEISYNVKFNRAWQDLRILVDTTAGDSTFGGGVVFNFKRENDDNVYLFAQLRNSPYTVYGEKYKICAYSEFDFDKTYNVKIELSGKSFIIYLDGVEVTKGDNVLPRGAASQVYFWNVSNQPVFLTDVKITVPEYETSLVGAFGTVSGNDKFGYYAEAGSALTTVDSSNFIDGEVSLDFTTSASAPNFRIMMDTTVGNKTFTNGFSVNFVNDGGIILTAQQRNGSWTKYATANVSDFAANKTYNVIFRVVGKSITLYLNGEIVAFSKDGIASRDSFTPSKIYFWAVGQSVIKNVKITPITKESYTTAFGTATGNAETVLGLNTKSAVKKDGYTVEAGKVTITAKAKFVDSWADLMFVFDTASTGTGLNGGFRVRIKRNGDNVIVSLEECGGGWKNYGMYTVCAATDFDADTYHDIKIVMEDTFVSVWFNGVAMCQNTTVVRKTTTNAYSEPYVWNNSTQTVNLFDLSIDRN